MSLDTARTSVYATSLQIRLRSPVFWKILMTYLRRLRYSAFVDISNMLTGLRSQLEQINEAIRVLERLGANTGKRRGRPPSWMAEMNAPKRRGRPLGSKNKPKASSPKASSKEDRG
jgi:hypothetical protein